MSKKTRAGFYMDDEMMRRCDLFLEQANVRSRNEFVNKAVHKYLCALEAQDVETYLSTHLTSAIRGAVDEGTNRTSGLLFKLAVEMDMMMHLLASTLELTDDELRLLRGRCVDEVKKTRGKISLDNAVSFQQSPDHDA